MLALCVAGGSASAFARPVHAQAAINDRTSTEAISPTPKEVTLKNDVGSITATRGSPGRVVVVRHWNFQEPSVQIKRNGDSLTVDARCPQETVNKCSVDLTLVLPDPFALTTDQGVGSVTLKDLTGNQKAHSGVGGIDATNVTAESFVADVGVGDARLVGLRATTVNASTGPGDVLVDAVTAPDAVDAHAGSGGVEVVVPPGAYNVAIDVGTGDEEVRGIEVDPDAPRQITASAGVGSVLVRSSDASAAPPSSSKPKHDFSPPGSHKPGTPGGSPEGGPSPSYATPPPSDGSGTPESSQPGSDDTSPESEGSSALTLTQHDDDGRSVVGIGLIALGGLLAVSSLAARNVTRRRD